MGGCRLKGKSEFLEICPVFLGSLEILISFVCIIISLWGGFFFLFFCFSLVTGAVTVSADKKETMFLIRTSQILSCLCAMTTSISICIHSAESEPLWTVIVLVVCDILICILSAIVASTIGDKCCYCCRRLETTMETTNPEEALACTPSQDNVWRYDRNRPSVIVQNTVIVPDSAALPTVYNSVRYVLPSEHGQARLSYFEEC
ncbi:uncharacterized protein LOC125243817 [Megalobrama amblycephala]|uniref:uncharacterized protein LOC125243817 n=1 Tax=Megalobrama amblycephala TaxID=75352 RepID=UPI002013EBF6|nr:uncharacterized protein LOC125243817 [Megalobrama amblycephala]XP_048009616.1 uncharacterized protein LOC125243817 [Megalobrama amblycephala]